MFGVESRIWNLLSRVADIVMLSVMYIICSIPVFTIGASASALYESCLKFSEQRESYVMKDFLNSFKRNFKTATFLWLILFSVGILLFVDLYIINHMNGLLQQVLRYIFLVLICVYLVVLSYSFPIQCKYNLKVIQVIKYSLLLGIGNLIPWTFLIIFMNLIPIILLVVNVNYILYMQPFVLGFLLGGIAYANSKIFSYIFEKQKYIEKRVIEK